jgi:hypothetical protein
MAKLTAAVDVASGRMKAVNRDRFDTGLSNLPAGRYVLTLAPQKDKRSDRANRAFHAMVSPWADSEGHAIEDLKRDVLGEVFGWREVPNAITGEMERVLVEPHTSKLDTERFAFLMNRTVEIAAECGVILELPDEYRERTERKTA